VRLRRKGEAWFIGTVNNSSPRTLSLPLSFLKSGGKYVAHIYSDDDRVTTRTKVAVSTRNVDAGATLEAVLKAAGGQAIWIEPAK
jgi:alpha-glucosidase